MTRAPWFPASREKIRHDLAEYDEGSHEHTAHAWADRFREHVSALLAEIEGDEMVCDRCHRRHGVVWFAPSDIWNAVMRDGDRGKPDEYGFCCPICFIQLAEERGVVTTGWLVTPFSDGPVRYASQIVLRAPNSHPQLVSRPDQGEAAKAHERSD